jgi:hypothetical protein
VAVLPGLVTMEVLDGSAYRRRRRTTGRVHLCAGRSRRIPGPGSGYQVAQSAPTRLGLGAVRPSLQERGFRGSGAAQGAGEPLLREVFAMREAAPARMDARCFNLPVVRGAAIRCRLLINRARGLRRNHPGGSVGRGNVFSSSMASTSNSASVIVSSSTGGVSSAVSTRLRLSISSINTPGNALPAPNTIQSGTPIAPPSAAMPHPLRRRPPRWRSPRRARCARPRKRREATEFVGRRITEERAELDEGNVQLSRVGDEVDQFPRLASPPAQRPPKLVRERLALGLRRHLPHELDGVARNDQQIVTLGRVLELRAIAGPARRPADRNGRPTEDRDESIARARGNMRRDPGQRHGIAIVSW